MLDNKEMIKDSNIGIIKRCIIDDNDIIVEETKINDIYNAYKKNTNDNSLEKNIIKVPSVVFNSYEYKNQYFIEIKDWTKINDTIIYLNDNNYEVESFIIKVELAIEEYFNYFNFIIIITIVISFIVYCLSIANVIIDEKASHYLYNYLGYTQREILTIQCIRLISLLLIVFLSNELIQFILKNLLNISNKISGIIYIVLGVLTIILIIINNIKNNDV